MFHLGAEDCRYSSIRHTGEGISRKERSKPKSPEVGDQMIGLGNYRYFGVSSRCHLWKVLSCEADEKAQSRSQSVLDALQRRKGLIHSH